MEREGEELLDLLTSPPFTRHRYAHAHHIQGDGHSSVQLAHGASPACRPPASEWIPVLLRTVRIRAPLLAADTHSSQWRVRGAPFVTVFKSG